MKHYSQTLNYSFMTIKILTIHCIHNFGSVFQSYGLVQFLRNQGYDAKLIDYRPDYYTKGRNALKKLLGIIMNYRAYTCQHKKYEEFIRCYLPVGKRFYTLDDLKEMYTNTDAIFIAGGDQLWNSFHACGRDDAYKLIFVNGTKKIAYGTSMGRNSFSKEELEDLSKKINDFYSIGLREQSTVTMLQPYTHVPIYHAADPVLLLEKKDYMPFIGNEPIINEPYLVMYLAAKSDLLSKTVEHISRKRGLKVVHVCGFQKKCDCDFFLKDTGPRELLNLIYYSEFVISASFHATLFSILLHKEFCTLLPEAGTNTRIEDLLGYLGISQRIIHNERDFVQLDTKIDFNKVDTICKHLVTKSKEQLIKAIEA